MAKKIKHKNRQKLVNILYWRIQCDSFHTVSSNCPVWTVLNWHLCLYMLHPHLTDDCCLSPAYHLSEHFNISEIPFTKREISERREILITIQLMFTDILIVIFIVVMNFSSSLLGYKHPLYQDWQCQRFWWWRELRVRDCVCVERLPGSWIQLPVQEWQPYPGASCRDALRQ